MVNGALTTEDGVESYRIDGVDEMEPFLTTVVSASDLWMFVSSTGALTAGRIDADHALFPYETDDRLHAAAGAVGPITLIARTVDGVREVWRPFAGEPSPAPRSARAMAKSVLGDRLVFEERNDRWGLTLRATWAPSDRHGWVRTVELSAAGDVAVEYEVLDGLLDVMPAGVDAHTEQIRSNLVNAYKRSECGPWGSLAVFSLESLVTDRAEPAESLTATVVWSAGFEEATIDLDAGSVTAFAVGRPVDGARLVTGRSGAYLLRGPVTVPAHGTASWMIVADTDRDHPGVLDACAVAADPDAIERVVADIELGSGQLRRLLEAADGAQTTGDRLADAHHLSNVLFNSMRGGVFPFGNTVPIGDLADFVRDRDRRVHARNAAWFTALGVEDDVRAVRAAAEATDDADLIRLVLEYLPLSFSRRHGDPSRPWNRFSIAVRDGDGGDVLSYEGNWRDIFQNWEALLRSYPDWFAHVVAKFVNASTFDGYNPYRISRAGIDWEVPDPTDPWSHIGYWGDHQIIYLLRLLEAWQEHDPGALAAWLDRPVFAYADVPYRVATFDEMVVDARDTITYDEGHDADIAVRVERIGTDGRLLQDADGELVRAGLLEKLVVPVLGKLSNLVPDGGIWLNTQRPEWNDANNALAGPGLSMVTLFHLRRYLEYVGALLDGGAPAAVMMSRSVVEWLDEVDGTLRSLPTHPIDDRQRRRAVESLSRSADAHRARQLRGEGFEPVDVDVERVTRLFAGAGAILDVAIAGARRDDGLYHSYNRISFPDADTAGIDHLGPMLEGQVAALSSGALDAADAADLVDALYASDIYRSDQDTFMLYPVRTLPSFLDRNRISDADADALRALGRPDALDAIVTGDVAGGLHFRPAAVNANAVDAMLDATDLTPAERQVVHEVYERVFDHHSFAGRSGSMYGYEGIGSVYWHMVAKLLLAVQEVYWSAVDRNVDRDTQQRLASAYRRVRDGLGFKKDPLTYGAFPTDCYSHTPMHAGAQQPGMTGQVKEEILTRFGELGVRVIGGRLVLTPGLLGPDDLFPPGTDAPAPARLTICGVPVSIVVGSDDAVTVVQADGARDTRDGLALEVAESRSIFGRDARTLSVEWVVGSRTLDRWRSV